jgi:drug/metabolite transporter (DMT)-like permease
VIIGVTAALLAALLYGVMAAAQATSIRRNGLWSRTTLVVVGGYVVGWGLHLVAIANLPLYLAQVGVGSSLVVSALIAAFILGEPLRREHWAAIVAMVAGLAVLAAASGDAGSSLFSAGTTITLYVAVVVTALLGWLAWRWQSPVSGVALGILSGVAYGISPIATRALVDFHWDLDSYATAACIGISGGLGFVLYSFSFSRTSVTAATAPEILFQTAIPAVVGIVLFHDQVRAGWWPAAASAFTVAVLAGILLCSAEARLDLMDEAAQAAEELGGRAANGVSG